MITKFNCKNVAVNYSITQQTRINTALRGRKILLLFFQLTVFSKKPGDYSNPFNFIT